MKIIYKITVAVLLFTMQNLFAQSPTPGFLWAKQAGEAAFDYGYGVSTDSLGNAYVAGKYEMNANFGGTWVTCAGNHDIFVAKYGPEGDFKWVRTAGGLWGDYARAVNCDAAGNVFVTGEIEMNCDFGNGTVVYSEGNNDPFVCMYNTDGTLQWAKRVGGGPDSDRGYGIVKTNDGVYVTGNFQNTADFNHTYTVTSHGAYDIFVAKYGLDGTFQWVKTVGGTGNDEGWAISADPQGNVYATGYFSGTVNFGGASVTSKGGADAFIAKYAPNGNLIWVKNAGSTGNDYGKGIAVDKLGKVFLTGYFRSKIYFGTLTLQASGTNDDIFTACYTSTGTPVWARRAGGTYADQARAIAVDQASNVYVTGNYAGTANFGGTNITGVDGADVFVAAYNSAGTFKWVLSATGAPDDPDSQGLQETGFSICADKWGNVITSGDYRSNSNFGATSLTKWNHTDIFVTKIGIPNSKPLAVISTPSTGTIYQAGASTSFSGSATDPEDGNLPAGSFKWRLDLHNGLQIAPGPVIPQGINSGSFIIPTTGETSANVFYRLTLVVWDIQNLKDSTFVDIYPKTSVLTLASQPSGLQLLLDGHAVTASHSVMAVSGMSRTIGVTSPQTLNGTNYVFDHWIHGGNSSQTILINDTNKTYTAVFNANGSGSVCTSAGSITRDLWTNAPGTNVSDIPVGTSPTSTSQVTIFESPTNDGDNYGQRMKGFICAPATGNYTFWIASDDKSELWLSTDELPANKVKIAFVSFYTGWREWTKYPSQQSEPISLIEGKKYYIEALHKEGVDGDNLSVGWQLPDGTQERPIPGSRLTPMDISSSQPIVNITSPFSGIQYSTPANIPINASAASSGASITKVEFYQGTTKIGEDLTSPYAYTWMNVTTGNYTLKAVAYNNLSQTATSQTVLVKVASCQTPTITPLSSTTKCSGAVILRTDTSAGNLYQWIKNGVNISGATSYSYAATETADFQVKVIKGSCISWSAPTSVKIKPQLAAVITAAGSTTFCVGGNVKLFANTCTGYTFQWKKNGAYISGATDSSYIATTTGSYQLQVTQNGSNAWSSLVNVHADTCLAARKGNNSEVIPSQVNAFKGSFEMNVFPNPNTGFFTIALNMPLTGEKKTIIKITNLVGQEVFIKEYMTQDDYMKETIELDRSLPTGIYTMQVIIGNRMESTKIILRR